MRQKILFVMAVAALLITSFAVVPSSTHALNITSVSVQVGNVTWCNTGGTCANQIWSLGGVPNLGNGQTLILGQNQPGVTGQPALNFDSSERAGVVNTGSSPAAGTACGSANPCATTVILNGVSIPISNAANSALANFNTDTNGGATGASKNESNNWGAAVGSIVIAGQQVTLWLAYADTSHTDACTFDTDGNCFPFTSGGACSATSVTGCWDGGPASGPGNSANAGGSAAATSFLAAPAGTNLNAGGPCGRNQSPCWDSGTLLFRINNVVPEPSALLLLGTGLVGLAAWVRRRRRDSK